MTTEVKRLIQVRTDKGARFKRDGYGKKRQLSDSWRKPRGQHNKQREQKKAKGALPKPGFGSPVAVRGMHPSGFFEVLVTSLKDLEGLDPKTQAVRLGATVGTRKRMIIQEQAIAAGLKVLNARVVRTTKAKPSRKKPVKKGEGEEKPEKKAPAKAKAAAPTKKAVKKTKTSPKSEKKVEKAEEKPEKKAPAKKTKALPKSEKKVQKADEKPEKKAPAKKTAAAKPKAGKPAEVKPKTAAKTKAKTTKSGVKKNE
jgi:large subunit ribosomal protein L32e